MTLFIQGQQIFKESNSIKTISSGLKDFVWCPVTPHKKVSSLVMSSDTSVGVTGGPQEDIGRGVHYTVSKFLYSECSLPKFSAGLNLQSTGCVRIENILMVSKDHRRVMYELTFSIMYVPVDYTPQG